MIPFPLVSVREGRAVSFRMSVFLHNGTCAFPGLEHNKKSKHVRSPAIQLGIGTVNLPDVNTRFG
jgi:hypothetical protein